MPKLPAACLVLLALTGLLACSSGDGDPATGEGATAVEAEGPACGAAVDPPTLDDDLAAVAEAVAAEAELVAAEPLAGYEVRCDNVDAISAAVPAAWDQQSPGPDDPPQAGFTVGPDLTGRVEAAPVVGLGALRFVGDPATPDFVNTNNAEGSLENGERTLPRRGDSVAEGCSALDPLPFTVPEGADGEALTGEVRPYVDCDGDRRAWLVAAGFPDAGQQYAVYLIGQALTAADAEALLQVLASLRTVGDHVPPQELPPLPAVDAP